MSQDFAVKRPPMRKRIAIAIAISVVAATAGGWFLFASKNNAPGTSETHQQDAAPAGPVPHERTSPNAAAPRVDAPDTSLIIRLMPQSDVRGFEKLDFGLGTYVWEIDMLVDKDDPSTSGFVYLSADGTKLLNGPLMDKRSRIMQTTPAADMQNPSLPASPPAQMQSGFTPTPPVNGPTSAQADPFDPQPGLETQANKAEYQRKQFYAGISQLNYMSTTQGSNIVYVLFDPLCHACQRLYKQQSAISAAYDVEFRWIPIFLDERSYPISALIQKIYNEDQAKGLETLDQVLNKQWKAEDHHSEIAALTAGDYEQVKPAGAVFLSIAKAVPGIGTPFVTFKGADGQIEAFGGVPLANDWASLKPRQQASN